MERPPELRGLRLVGFWAYAITGFVVILAVGAVLVLLMVTGGGP